MATIRIEDNTFAAACYSHNSIAELERALVEAADPHDCAEWNLTAAEWRDQIELALTAKLADAE